MFLLHWRMCVLELNEESEPWKSMLYSLCKEFGFVFLNQAHDCYKIQGKKNVSGNHAISSFILIHN